ncbi:hypothetical protein FLM48_10625 [Shewanella sp. Scap07]|uniref:hypothetical protein n=1 Tax=Shewanella sp. Scap07 TaxID=2589987 RepID=UPI0015B8128C|nr:hypothetical protein [Shewanella sp. Scap07]QLE85488.1 hypothetical protein FLM48_10625 [Shewanella sp. Scap07]
MKVVGLAFGLLMMVFSHSTVAGDYYDDWKVIQVPTGETEELYWGVYQCEWTGLAGVQTVITHLYNNTDNAQRVRAPVHWVWDIDGEKKPCEAESRAGWLSQTVIKDIMKNEYSPIAPFPTLAVYEYNSCSGSKRNGAIFIGTNNDANQMKVYVNKGTAFPETLIYSGSVINEVNFNTYQSGYHSVRVKLDNGSSMYSFANVKACSNPPIGEPDH